MYAGEGQFKARGTPSHGPTPRLQLVQGFEDLYAVPDGTAQLNQACEAVSSAILRQPSPATSSAGQALAVLLPGLVNCRWADPLLSGFWRQPARPCHVGGALWLFVASPKACANVTFPCFLRSVTLPDDRQGAATCTTAIALGAAAGGCPGTATVTADVALPLGVSAGADSGAGNGAAYTGTLLLTFAGPVSGWQLEEAIHLAAQLGRTLRHAMKQAMEVSERVSLRA